VIYDAKVRLTLHVDEFGDTTVPSCDFNDILSQVSKTGIESLGDFEFCASKTVCFVGVVVRVMVADILPFKTLEVS
jgi:hypothetical protein